MTRAVTSWFLNQLKQQAVVPKRTFTISGSDYSNYVKTWPKVRAKWDQIQPSQLKMKLANGDQTFNLFITDKSALTNSCEVKFGFTHPTSGDEMMTVFAGAIENVRYRGTNVSLSIRDKIKAFTSAQVGNQETPVSFTNTDYWPQDIIWPIITSYGGLSNIQSTSNPDIDYQSWLDWGSVFSADNIYIQAEFFDKKVGEVITKMARMLHTGVFIEDNKLYFTRFTQASSDNIIISEDIITGLSVRLDDKDLVNRQFVYVGYDSSSKSWGAHPFTQSTVSQQTFGNRENVIKDENVWYVDSVGGSNLADRMIRTAKEPVERYEIKTTLEPFAQQIGDTIKLSNSFYGISCVDHYRLMSYELDLNDFIMNITIDKSQIGDSFVLDDAYWGVLDTTGRGTLL